MASVKDEDRGTTKRQGLQRSNSSSPSIAMERGTAQNFKLQQDNKYAYEEQTLKRKMTKRRPTKVALNDTLRRIRRLVVEGRTNLEIQSILQLDERTFYRYMAKIHETDQALFLEQEKESLASELGVFRDRLLKSYRWFIAMADNKQINPSIRMEAQRNAAEVAWALTMLKFEGPRIMQKPGILDNLYQNSSYQRLKKAETKKSIASSSSFSYKQEKEEKEDHSMNL